MMNFPFGICVQAVPQKIYEEVLCICSIYKYQQGKIVQIQNLALFDEIVYLEQIFDNEFTAIDLRQKIIVNIVLYDIKIRKQSIYVSQYMRKPFQTKIYSNYYFEKYQYFEHISIQVVGELLKIRLNTICSQYNCSVIALHHVNDEFIISRVNNTVVKQPMIWSLTTEEALQYVRLIHEQKTIGSINVSLNIDSQTLWRKYGITRDQIKLTYLVNIFRQYYSHQLENQDISNIIGFSDIICEEIEIICPNFFQLISQIQ